MGGLILVLAVLRWFISLVLYATSRWHVSVMCIADVPVAIIIMVACVPHTAEFAQLNLSEY